MSRKFNFIFSKLVEDNDNDFVGYIAYSLYKQDKIEHIENLKKEKKSEDIGDADLEGFHIATSSPNIVSSYRLKAEAMLNEFMNDTLSESIGEIREEVREEYRDLLREVVEPLKPESKLREYGHAIAQEILSAVIIALIISGIFLVTAVNSRGFDQTMEYYFGYVKKSQVDSLNIK